MDAQLHVDLLAGRQLFDRAAANFQELATFCDSDNVLSQKRLEGGRDAAKHTLRDALQYYYACLLRFAIELLDGEMSHGAAPPRMTPQEVERVLVEATLAHTTGNVSEAAGLLSIDRGTVYAKIGLYGVWPGASLRQANR